MVEHGSVKPAMEVQFFQSPPYYYEHIKTKYAYNNVANQKSLRFLLTFRFNYIKLKNIVGAHSNYLTNI